MTNLQNLLSAETPFLTDGGFETWMFFVEGFEAPEFAAIVLMDDEGFRQKAREYFERFLKMAAVANTGYVLDTNTWRGCTQWAGALGVSEAGLLRLSRDAVEFARRLRDEWRGRVSPVLINGVVGPAGDGYATETLLTATDAFALHLPQIEVFAETGVDMISALTMTNVPEVVGIAKAAEAKGLPVVISFTVETDGRLHSGQSLAEAITETDRETNASPAYYMVNCAHPDHFKHVLDGDSAWLNRIGGVRANASRMSHEELDQAEELDAGNPQEFSELHVELAASLPALKVVGGCCGTDHRHVEHVSRHLHHKDRKAA